MPRHLRVKMERKTFRFDHTPTKAINLILGFIIIDWIMLSLTQP